MLGQPLLGCLGVYHLPIVNPTPLHLLEEGGTVEAHIRAGGLFDWAIMEVVLGDRTTSSSHMVTQSVRDDALLREVFLHCIILAPA